MIKTLRITSVLAAIAAAVLIYYFVIPVVVGTGGDERVDKVLNEPTVVDKFQQNADTHVRPTKGKTAPLVQQAIAFAGYLNPKIPAGPRGPRGPKTLPGSVIGPTSPKFTVFATTYFGGNPELSQALIDEPGKGKHWVKQSSMVGHLFIEQIKDGIVVVKSSKETYELAIEANPKAAPAKRTFPASKSTKSQSPVRRSSPTYSKAASGASKAPSKPPVQLSSAELIRKQKAAADLVAKLEVMRNNHKRNPDGNSEVMAARIGELMSYYKPTQVSAEDAQNLTKLGEKVKNGGKDPNQMSALIKGGKIDAGPAKPASQSGK